MDASSLTASIDRIPTYRFYGRVTAILVMLVEVGGGWRTSSRWVGGFIC